MAITNIYICDAHKLGLGCKNHCHIVNDCAACYTAMKANAQNVLSSMRKQRQINNFYLKNR